MPNIKHLLPGLMLLLVLSCDNQTLGTMKKPESLTGEPLAGSQTLVLTGSSYLAKTVTINGRGLDTSSVRTIADSVSSIFASQYPDGTLISEAGASAVPDYTIDFTAGTPVSDIFYGVNIQIASKVYLADPVYRELAKNLKLDLIRFPGGQERVKYDRTAAVDAKWEFGSSAEYQYLLTGADVANYIALCRLVGAKADLEFNVFTNDPAMWKSAADHIVNGLNYNLEYMSVGNEPDINNNSNWSLFGASSVTEAMNSYTTRYVDYAQQIRQVKPVTFVFGELANNADPILSQFLNHLPTINDTPPGAFSAHWYLLGDYGQGTDKPDFPSVSHLVISGNSGRNIRSLAAIHTAIRAKLDDTQPGSKVIIGEMATSWSATAAGADVEDTLATAIYTAEVMEYGRTLGIDSIQYFGLSDPSSFAPWNSAMIVENGGAFFVRPQYYSRMLIKHAWGNITVPVTSGQTDNYSIYASSDGTADYLMLINRTVNVSYKKVLRLLSSANPDGASVEVLILPQSVTVIKLPH